MANKETKGYEKIVSLFEPGTFVELGAHLRRRDANGDAGEYDAVICGYGAINSKLTFAFVQDMSRTSGALDDIGAEKIRRLYEQAINNGAPVVGVFDSAGASVYDGTAALAAYGKVMKCVSDASGVVPQIAYITGVCSGVSAMIAAMFDITVTVDGVSELYVNTGCELDIPAVATSDEADGAAKVRALVDILPQNNKSVADVAPLDDPARACNISGLSGLDLVAAIADGGSVTQLYANDADGVVTALCHIGGRLAGVVATDAKVDGGRITSAGAKQAARLVKFCDSFNIPVVTLVDSLGVAEGDDEELATAGARLGALYLKATTAKVTAITGKAFGASFLLLGSRALGADLAIAVNGAQMGAMTPDRAVAFVWNDKITADKSRAEVEAEWTEKYASAEAAAANGDIDDIVAPEELRARICSALYMLSAKADTTPAKKHLSMPL
ncbi:MAG: hypothetical protein IJX74_00700 [Clostridia bacterium]|nr:hypothetical protein [Clostridia bacterium]